MNDYGYNVVRANGSYRFHLLPVGPYTTALCGKPDPRYNAHPLSSHSNRARWVRYSAAPSGMDSSLCKKCEVEAQKVVAQMEAERVAPSGGAQL